jgi:hypothetical protein
MVATREMEPVVVSSPAAAETGRGRVKVKRMKVTNAIAASLRILITPASLSRMQIWQYYYSIVCYVGQ